MHDNYNNNITSTVMVTMRIPMKVHKVNCDDTGPDESPPVKVRWANPYTCIYVFIILPSVLPDVLLGTQFQSKCVFFSHLHSSHCVCLSNQLEVHGVEFIF